MMGMDLLEFLALLKTIGFNYNYLDEEEPKKETLLKKHVIESYSKFIRSSTAHGATNVMLALRTCKFLDIF